MAENESVQPPQQPSNSESGVPSSGEISKDAKTMAMLCHLLGIFTCFLGPLIIWLLKKEEHPFIDEQGKEALNFQITMAIGYVVSSFLIPLFCIWGVLWFAVFVINLVFGIIASMKTSNGEHYKYPISLRLIK